MATRPDWYTNPTESRDCVEVTAGEHPAAYGKANYRVPRKRLLRSAYGDLARDRYHYRRTIASSVSANYGQQHPERGRQIIVLF